MRLSVLECPKCGGELDFTDEPNVYICPYCDSVTTIANEEDEQEVKEEIKSDSCETYVIDFDSLPKAKQEPITLEKLDNVRHSTPEPKNDRSILKTAVGAMVGIHVAKKGVRTMGKEIKNLAPAVKDIIDLFK